MASSLLDLGLSERRHRVAYGYIGEKMGRAASKGFVQQTYRIGFTARDFLLTKSVPRTSSTGITQKPV